MMVSFYKLPILGRIMSKYDGLVRSNRSKTGLNRFRPDLRLQATENAHKKTALLWGGLTRSKLGLTFPVPVYFGFGL